jgi:branched-chain amino acid transport system substrate-binding protein
MKLLTFASRLFILVAFLLTACGPQVTPTPIQGQPSLMPRIENTPLPLQRTILVGFSVSQSGNLSQESKKQTNGLLLWIKQVNERGGIPLASNLVVKFEPRFYDDRSDSEQAKAVYEKLIVEDKVAFLFGPYSSTLTDAVAPINDQYDKIMISAGAASDNIFKKSYSGIYQIYTPGSKYLTGAIDLLARQDPAAKRIAIVYQNDRFSTSVIASLKEYAETRGFEIVAFENYPSGTTDFEALIAQLALLKPDAILGGGHLLDGQAFARQAHERGLNPKYMALLVAPADTGFATLGEAAIGVIGPSQWEPQAKYQPDFGPSVSEFVQAYREAYGEEPTYHAAGGYAAGLVLEKALLTAGSLDPDKVTSALNRTSMITFFGPIRFEREELTRGLQIGHEMVYIQWQKQPDGSLAKEIVWPPGARTAEAIYPR